MRCERFLLVEDDMRVPAVRSNQGLGFTAQVLVSAQLMALRQQRVLLEVPYNASWPEHGLAHAFAPRWCSVPPFTQQCFYEQWTHCRPPADDASSPHAVPLTGGGKVRRFLRRWPPPHAPVVRVKLSWLLNSPWFWRKECYESTAAAAALRFLFRPRRWIRTLGQCSLRTNGLAPRKFVTVHVRASHEKIAELRAHGHSLPSQMQLQALTAAVASSLSTTHIFVQTANAEPLTQFAAFAASSAPSTLKLGFTRNPRALHDSWGGGSRGNETAQSIVAAVNLWVASQGLAIISPTFSAWTDLLRPQLGALTRPALDELKLCCSCSQRDRRSGNVAVIRKSSSGAEKSRKSDRVLNVLREHSVEPRPAHRCGVVEP